MLLDLIRNLFNKLGIIVLVAFFLSRSSLIKSFLQKAKLSKKDMFIFSFVFGLIGIIGTYSGVPVAGAIANSRSIGVIVAGLFGGPFIGIVAGLIAGIHRMVIPDGRFTAIACGISTILGGVIAGYAKPYMMRAKKKWLFGVWLTILIEALQMGIILLIARPFPEALDLVKIIFVPMAFINAAGTGAFILLIQQIHEENEYNAALKASLSLKIASKTLPFLRKGLNQASATKVCEILYDYTGVSAVSITNKDRILGHMGLAADHHLPGGPLSTRITKDVINRGEYILAHTKEEIGCISKACPLASAIIVPLYMKEHMLGTLKLYRAQAYAMTYSDIEMAKGLAYLFSTQLELSQIAYQEELLVKSEIKALQAQIQPHFLFNALNTIISLCRTQPLKARDLLTNLSQYLRKSFTSSEPFIPIEEELGHIRNYLSIEEARYVNRLQVTYDVDEKVAGMIPPLILQPLVENALKHGFADQNKDCRLHIAIKDLAQDVAYEVTDNGKGMLLHEDGSPLLAGGNSTGIGLSNVRSRLLTIYNRQLSIESDSTSGTSIRFTLPKEVPTK